MNQTAGFFLQPPVTVLHSGLMSRRRIPLVSLVAVMLLSACGGPLFKVKPAADLPPLPSTSKSVEGGGIKMRVAPLLTDEQSQELFEANLPASGILPLRVELVFPNEGAVDPRKVKFRLSDSQNHEWKLLSTKSAVKRIMNAEEIKLYNPHSKKQFESDFGAYDLDLKTPLSPAKLERRGFLFFETPKKVPVEKANLTLSVERLPTPLTINVN